MWQTDVWASWPANDRKRCPKNFNWHHKQSQHILERRKKNCYPTSGNFGLTINKFGLKFLFSGQNLRQFWIKIHSTRFHRHRFHHPHRPTPVWIYWLTNYNTFIRNFPKLTNFRLLFKETNKMWNLAFLNLEHWLESIDQVWSIEMCSFLAKRVKTFPYRK